MVTVLGYLWASPWIAVLLALGLPTLLVLWPLGLLRVTRVTFVGGIPVLWCAGRIADYLGAWRPRAGGLWRWEGFTPGPVVLIWVPDPGPQTLIHEAIGHARKQALPLGIFYPLVYLTLLWRYGYARHPFERAARRVAGQVD